MSQSPEPNDDYAHPRFLDDHIFSQNEDRRPQLNETVASRRSNIPDTIAKPTSDAGGMGRDSSMRNGMQMYEVAFDDDGSIEDELETVDRAVIFDQTDGNNFNLEGSIGQELFERLISLSHPFIVRKLAKKEHEVAESIRVHNSPEGPSIESSIHQLPLVNDMYPQHYNECIGAGEWADDAPMDEAAGDLEEAWEMADYESISMDYCSEELHGWAWEHEGETYADGRVG